MKSKLKLTDYVQLEKRLGILTLKNIDTGKYILMVSGVLELNRETFDEQEDYGNVVFINLEHLLGSIFQFGRSILNANPRSSKALGKFEQDDLQAFIQDSLDKLKETPKEYSRLHLMLIADTIDTYQLSLQALDDINDAKPDKIIKINEVTLNHE